MPRNGQKPHYCPYKGFWRVTQKSRNPLKLHSSPSAGVAVFGLLAKIMSKTGDPFDRMLAAQSLLEGIPLLSRDRVFESMKVPIIW